MKNLVYILIAIVAVVGLLAVIRAAKSTTSNNDTLVAYFSATGNTKSVASALAAATGADLFEILPEQPYTSEDLNWQNDKSRSSIEMADKNSRPIIASKIENIAKYKTIFIGFPIWWGREPSIIDTFMESYDFADKTIVPFATSGSSDIGDVATNLKSLAPNATVLNGKRFPTNVSMEELKTWADEEIK